MAETKVRTPDGRVITVQHPDDATPDEILAYAQQNYAPKSQAIATASDPLEQPSPQSAGGTFFDRTIRTFLNNMMAVPKGAGEMLALGGAGLQTGAENLLGLGPPEGHFRQNLEAHRETLPASALRAIPAPTVEGMGAGIRSLPALMPGGESFGERFGQEQQQIGAELEQSRAANPWAAKAGEVAGDVLTLISLRSPAAKGINRAETALVGKRPDILFGGAAKATESNLRFLLDRTIMSAPMRKLARGAGRAAETGFEAAVLDVLKGDDPLETAAYAAGGQMGGSLLLEAGKGIVSGGPAQAGLKIALTAVAAGSLWQMMKTVTPGGEDRLIESMETGYDKVAFALALGAVSGVAGAGRLRGTEWAERFPKSMDALSTIPRGTAVSLLEDWRDSGEQLRGQMEAVAQKIAQDPAYFGEAAAEKIRSGIERGELSSTLTELMGNQEFRKRYDRLHPFNSLSPGK